MKYLFQLVMAFAVIAFLPSCSGNADSASHEEAVEEVHEHAEDAAEEALSLNDGVKWQSDAATTENVSALKTMADNFNADTGGDAEQFRALGENLQEGLNQLIQQCTMDGPAHDELHKWLEPVIKNIKNLKDVADADEGQKLLTELKGRLNNYSNFFQYDN
ncbi:MAG: hypothetical protein J5I50_01355 [Chitinophagaceae bacterium]|nr:hypothetical protein [Chitinophagaceae bacterium]